MDWIDIAFWMVGIGTLITASIALAGELKRRKHQNKPAGKRVKHIIWKRPTFAIFIILAIISIGLAIIPKVAAIDLAANIISPKDGSSVPERFFIDGYINRELNSGQYLYIVVEVGGRWWPQYGEVTPEHSSNTGYYEFMTPVYCGNADMVGKPLGIKAILVDSFIHQNFQSWLQISSKKEWPGILTAKVSQWGNVEVLDSITVLRQ